MKMFQKSFQKSMRALLLALSLALALPGALPFSGRTASAEAASGEKTPHKFVLLKGQTLDIDTGSSKTADWSSSKKSVVSVNAEGTVKARKKGKAVVTAVIGKKELTYKITVEAPSLSKKSLSLTVGKSASLDLNGTSQKITWKSSDKKVAAVTEDGRVIAKGAGTATITAIVLKKSFPCEVTVKKASSGTSSGGNNTSSNTGSTPQTGESSGSLDASSLVWRTASGKKFHRTSTCSNMRHPWQVTVQEARSAGLTPCSKCY